MFLSRHSFRADRRIAAVLIAAVLAFSAAACGSTTEGSAPGAATECTPGPGFPVTIQSTQGSAEIKCEPQRVITLGQGSTETAVALGKTPVGVEKYTWSADETGQQPWIRAAIEEKGGTLPELVGEGAQLDLEKIVELEPDVILAPWSGLTQEQFDALNKIAPTVSYPGKPWSINWDEQITLIGKALGKPAEAAGLIDDLNTELADAAKANPDYANYTFSYIYTTPDTLGVFLPDEQRVAVVRALGLKLDPVVETLPETEGTDSSVIGYEAADKLDNSQLIFTFYSSEEEAKKTMENKLYAQIPAIKRGAVVYGRDAAFVTASSMINPYTLPYALDRYIPLIDEAIKKVDG